MRINPVFPLLGLCLGISLAATQAAPIRALLVTGGCCHNYPFQSEALTKAVSAKADVTWTVLNEGGRGTKAQIDLYKNPDWAKPYDVIVHNECFAGTANEDYIRTITQAHKAGKPAVVIHCAMHTYRAAKINDWREFLGVTSRRHDHQSNYEVKVTDRSHPIMQEFPETWVTPKDELYIVDKLWPKARSLATTVSERDKKPHTVFWVNQYGKARVFGTTYGHSDATFRDPVFLNTVTRGLLWTVGQLGHSKSGNLQSSIKTILDVGPKGQGNVQAGQAWSRLVQADASALPHLLQAMNKANPLAANWLRSAAETITDRTLAAEGQLPLTELGDYLLDTGNEPRARRFAYEIVARISPETARQLIPGMLNDPSVELRYDAVQQLIDGAANLVKGGMKQAGVITYRQALGFARDVGQINQITESLTSLGQVVDLPRHFGFLMEWQVAGPFDNTGRKGFDTVFPPEKSVDLKSTYQGKSDKVGWKPFVSRSEYGKVDINQVCEPLKEVTAYAFTEFEANSPQAAQLRLGCKNAWKIWFNGKLVFGRDEYHRGQQIDQYTLPVQLKAGANTILIKICQNEQTEEWTKEWEFQMRVCDATGTAILSRDRLPTEDSALSRPKPNKTAQR